ncbi:hypothetical protein DICPUDRAFT_148173 [Dictyostelium purpureum]|uniref:PIPK domain-containing protein n=1 Tax=Dictyostelium purpureum TaxID=5786 RepID=F0ZAF9_DICPU|nr:uncharacterized protein DICPUDRAFT_148173 [Dictyostelium purpureum]EGC39045.1 hypothetical protein DICPUDRAFT_148173 [Dictyostelium purpureum]|eukprot:XP_003284395.1 hypothetical protein DICPUDRAFT_148173 [Dictyostelium purpureum]
MYDFLFMCVFLFFVGFIISLVLSFYIGSFKDTKTNVNVDWGSQVSHLQLIHQNQHQQLQLKHIQQYQKLQLKHIEQNQKYQKYQRQKQRKQIQKLQKLLKIQQRQHLQQQEQLQKLQQIITQQPKQPEKPQQTQQLQQPQIKNDPAPQIGIDQIKPKDIDLPLVNSNRWLDLQPTKPPSVSLEPKLLNNAPPSTSPQQPNNSSTPSSSSSYRLVNPFNVLKYSKKVMEENLYRPSASVNHSKKLVQDQETQQYINLLTIGFKKLFESDIDSKAINGQNNNSNNNCNNLNVNNVNINNKNSIEETPTNQKDGACISDFSNEDFNQATNIEIKIDSDLDLEEQIINQFHHLQVPHQPVSTSESSSATVTTTTDSLKITTITSPAVTTNKSSTASLTSSLSDNWQFTIFSPKVFKEIRKYYNVDKDFLRTKSIGSPEISDIVKFLEVQTVGRSGSFFYKSEDSKYFIKTIPSSEYNTFTKLFPSYYQHIKKYPNSLLPRFMGVYRLKLSGASYYSSAHRDIIFVVMANLFYSEQKLEIKEKYDLKGSTIGRYVDVNQFQQQLAKEQQQHLNGTDSLNTSIGSNSSCYNSSQINGVDNSNNIQTQDLTFKDLNLKRKIHLGKLKKVFIQQLSIDSEWMCSHGICDYSLLVGLHLSDKKSIQTLKESQGPKSLEKKDISYFKKDFNGIVESTHTPPQPPPLSTSNIIYESNTEESDGGIVYYLGLIDILTTYNLKKRGENALKGMLFDRTQISAINPKDYQSRFIKYIESIVE